MEEAIVRLVVREALVALEREEVGINGGHLPETLRPISQRLGEVLRLAVSNINLSAVRFWFWMDQNNGIIYISRRAQHMYSEHIGLKSEIFPPQSYASLRATILQKGFTQSTSPVLFNT